MNLESIVKSTGAGFKTAGRKTQESAPLWAPPLVGAGIITNLFYGSSYLLPAFFTLGLVGLAAYALARPLWHFYYNHKYKK